MLFFLAICAAFLGGLIVNNTLRRVLKQLLRDTDELETTDNTFFKQMKLRYENCLRIGREIRNTEAFAAKYLEKYRNYGISIHGYEKISSGCATVCVIAGCAGAWTSTTYRLEMLLVGFLAMYMIAGSRKLLDVYEKKRRMTNNIVDFFENRYYAATREQKRETYAPTPKPTVQKEEIKEPFSAEDSRIIDDILREYLG